MADILTCYYRPKPGGLCTRLFRAMDALLARGHRVHYLAVEKFPIHHPRCVFHRFPWPVRHSDTLAFWAVFHLLAPVFLAFIAIRHRIVHAFAFGPTYAFLMQPLRLFRGTLLTCFLRGDTILSHHLQGRSRWIIALDQWLEGLALKGTKIVGVSSSLLETVLERHGISRRNTHTILPNDLPRPIASAARKFDLPLNLATVGILEPMKNQRHVLKVLHKVTHKPWHLYLYGPGPEEAQLKRIAADYQIDDRVSFMGWTDRKQIWSRTDLLLSASLYEGMPNAILEALANGVPVLASDIPAHRDLLPPDQLVPPGNPRQWQSALLAIFENPQAALPAMAEHQKRFASHLQFDWDERIVQLITGRT